MDKKSKKKKKEYPWEGTDAELHKGVLTHNPFQKLLEKQGKKGSSSRAR